MSTSAGVLRVLIVGSGFAGLGMGARLRQAGFEDFAILEAASRVGGTWRDNHYPGAACDIESHLYSFSFAPNAQWSRIYAPQPEILAYLEACVDRFGLRPHLRLDTAATRATFDEAAGVWTVETSRGETLRARVLVAGCGGLSRPVYPQLEGLESFAGASFHSARWEHGVSLEGKTVGVIGTGASAIQLVPAIAPQTGRLVLFQRTPPWILPKQDRAYSTGELTRFRRGTFWQKLERLKQYTRHELLAAGFVWQPAILRWAQRFAHQHLEAAIGDEGLRAKLRPSYQMGCKRVLLSNDYYPALARSNVQVVTEPITRVTPSGVQTADGREHRLDVLVHATGFQAADPVSPFEVRGRGGVSLDEAWRDGALAYLGTSVAGFPNLFLIVGPNTGLGHSSMVYMIESQVQYILSAVKRLSRDGWKAVDVRADAQRTYNERLHARFPRTVWNTGCASWYRAKNGKNTTLWPGFTFEFRWRTRRFDAAPYTIDR